MKLDDIKKLQQKKYRAEFGHFLVEGEHLLLELHKAAARNPALLASQLYVTAAYQHWESPFKTQLISERQMAQIADTHTPQGILAVVPMAALTTTAATTPTRWLRRRSSSSSRARSCGGARGGPSSFACGPSA